MTQVGCGGLWNSLFKTNSGCVVSCAWCFSGFLNVHAEARQVQEHLQVSLGLHVATHDTEGQPGASPAAHHCWRQGVERSFVGCQVIWVQGVGVEQAAAIVQHDAGTACHDTATES